MGMRQMFDGHASVNNFFWGCRPPKYLTDVCPSNILGVYTPQIFDGCMSVKHLGIYTPKITDAWACVKYLTDMHPSNILGLETPQIFDGHTSVKYFGGVDPPNI